MKTELLELLRQQSFQDMNETIMSKSRYLIKHYYFHYYGNQYRKNMKSVLDNTTKIMKQKSASVITKTLSEYKEDRKQVSINTQKIIISILLASIDERKLLLMFQDIFSLVLDGDREIKQIKLAYNNMLERMEKLE